MIDMTWRKSTYSGGDNGNCLEVRDGVAGAVPVRDSKRPEAAHLVIPGPAWSAFVRRVKG